MVIISINKMKVNQKDLVLISYPFSSFERSKIRPAIIVSNNAFNKKSDDCVAIPLTTVLKDEPYSATINQNDLIKGRLIKTSRARADKIFNFNKKPIIKIIGTINDNAFRKIISEINRIF